MKTLAAALAFGAALVPRLAEACPMCASQQPGGVARIVALGLMILVPFSIAFVVFRALRRAGGAAVDERPRLADATRAGGSRGRAMREPRP